MSLVVSGIIEVSMNKITLVNSVRADDWTAGIATIDACMMQAWSFESKTTSCDKSGLHVHFKNLTNKSKILFVVK